MLERLKTSDAIAEQPCKSEVSLSNFKVESQIQIFPSQTEMDQDFSNSNLVLPNGIDLANEVLDLRDLTDRYWRIIQTQHVRISLLENELLCVKIAKL